ncbi:MAG: hypothetical protein MJ146_03480 [Clostridia bacterium]|nr:hypothetical protein [Clostridia bacterium]
MKKRILSMLLILTLIPTVSFAGTGVTKEENVYVIQKSDGDVEDVIVTDHLVNDGKLDTIYDRSDLKDIKNTNGEEKFVQKGESLKWAAKGNDIFYQGRTDKEIPIKVDVKYFMNGKELSGKKIQGKKGDFKILLTYTSSIPFAVVAGMLLQDDNYSHVKVTAGKVIDDGEKTIVMGLAAPGLGAPIIGNQIKVTGHAESFDVTDIMAFATSSLFQADLSQLGELDLGAKQLVSGSDQLYRALLKLNHSIPSLTDGIAKLNSGAKGVNSGIERINMAISKLYPGALQLQAGVDELYSQVTGDTLKDGIAKLKKGAVEIDAMAAALAANDINLINAEKSVKATLYSMYKEGAIDIDQYALLKNALLGTGSAFKTSMALAKTGQTAVAGLLAVAGKKLGDGADEFDESMTKLVDGVGQIKGGVDSLAFGLGEISDGLEGGLADGALALANGMETLNANTKTLALGAGQLLDGSKALRDGMSKLYTDGISKITSLGGLNLGSNFKNFTRLGKGMSGNVKFIFKIVVAESQK